MESDRFSLDPILGVLNIKQRCSFYDNLSNFIKRKSPVVSTLEFKGEVAINLAAAIKKDILASNDKVKTASTNLLYTIVLNLEWMHSSSWGFTNSLLTNDPFSKSCELTKAAMLTNICNGTFHLNPVVLTDKVASHQIKEAIIFISHKIPNEKCMSLLQSEIIPAMFDKNTNHDARDEFIELGMHLAKSVDIFSFGSLEQNELLTQIIDKYLKSVGEFRDAQYENWYKLWIFLIRICTRKLHTNSQLANRSLRVVEVAFRNSTSTSQRLQAYDCWKQLIDNCSLDMEFMCSPKQIRLLVTPLKAKFSRMASVVEKRFDTFVYLLEKLRDKSTLCLQDFLEFCFGPFSDAPKTQKVQTHGLKTVHCAKALIAIIGHGHLYGDCVPCEDVIDLSRPVIDDTNYPKYSQILFLSAVECCFSLTDSHGGECRSILQCIWGTLLNFTQKSDNVTKRNFAVNLGKTFETTINKAEPTDELSWTFLGCVCEVILMKKLEDVLNLKENIFTIGVALLGQNLQNCNFNRNPIENFVFDCLEKESGEGVNYHKIASQCFIDNNSKWVNNSQLCKIWMKCTYYNDLCYLIWPCNNNLDHFENLEEFNSKWTSVYKVNVKGESAKSQLLTEIDKLFANNPLMSSSKIVKILELISTVENQASKEFIGRFIKTVEGIISYPNLPKDVLRKLVTIVTKYLDYICLLCQSDRYDDALKELCDCIQQITLIHKNYTLLLKLELTLKIVEKRTLEKFSTYLTPFLTDLVKSHEADALKPAQKILRLLEHKDEMTDAMLPPINTPRSLRIINLASHVSNNNNNAKRKDSPSPVPNLRGSQMKNLPVTTRTGRILAQSSTKSKKPSLGFLNEDSSSSDYVKVDTKVEINLDKLSEHQIDIMKKRREDIPALYQDLSRSVDFTDSNSLTVENASKKEETPTNGTVLRRSSPRLSSPVKKAESPKTSPPMLCKVFVEKIEKTLSPELAKNLSLSPMNRSHGRTTPSIESYQLKKKLFEDTPNSDNVTSTGTNGNHSDCSVGESENSTSFSMLRRSSRKRTNRRTMTLGLSNKTTPREPEKKTENATENLTDDKPVEKTIIPTNIVETPKAPFERKSRTNRNRVAKIVPTIVEKPSEIAEKPSKIAEKPSKTVEKLSKIVEKSSKIVEAKSDEKLPLNDEKEAGEPEVKQAELEGAGKDEITDVGKEETVDVGKEETAKVVATDDGEVGAADKEETDHKDEGIKTRPKRNKVAREPVDFIWDIYSLDTSQSCGKKRRRSDPIAAPKAKKPNKESTPTTGSGNEKKTTKKSRKSGRSLPKTEEVVTPLAPEAKTTSDESSKMADDTYDFEPSKDDATFDWQPLKHNIKVAIPTVVEQKSAEEVETQTTADLTNVDGFDSFDSVKAVHDSSSPVSQKTAISPSTENDKSSTKIDETFGDMVESTQEAPVTRRKTRSLSFAPVQADKKEGSKSAESSPSTKSTAMKDLTSWLIPREPVKESQLFSNSTKDSSVATTATLNSHCKSLTPLECLNVQSKADLGDLVTLEDTQSYRTDSSTISALAPSPEKDLPASPITCDTPERNVEFLTDTLNISPIDFNQLQNSEEPAEQDGGSGSEDVTLVPGARSSKLLQMVNAPSPIAKLNKWKMAPRSPSISRIRLSRRRKGDMRRLDVLTFSREIPSPLTQPGTSILKRKSCSTGDIGSPAPKRKRVNFSDPAITEQKIFLKDQNEFDKFTPPATIADLSQDGDDDVFGDDAESLEISPIPAQSNLLSLDNFIDKDKALRIVRHLFEDGADLDELRPKLQRIASDLADNLPVVNVVDDFLHEPDSDLSIFVVKLITVVENLPHSDLGSFVNKLVDVFGRDQVLKCLTVDMKIDDFKDTFKSFLEKLDGDECRNGFLLWTMQFVGAKLPANMTSLKAQFEVLHDQFNKITE